MNLLRRKPIGRTLTPTNMRSEMDRVFDRWFGDPLDVAWPTSGESWAPALDVIDGEAAVTIKAEVPGMAAKDVNVSVRDNTLVLSGEKDESNEEKGENFYLSERRFGSFQRAIDLPAGVDADKITAEQAHGVLTITIPKSKIAKAKQVPVKAAD